MPKGSLPARDARPAGRPAATSRAELAAAGRSLIHRQGYRATTVDQIAAAAGASRRTFFRYFAGKADVVWFGHEDEVGALEAQLRAMPPAMSTGTAIRMSVLAVLHDHPGGTAAWRARHQLVLDEPEVAAAGAVRHSAWAHAVSLFAAERAGQDAAGLPAQLVGRLTLAAVLTATDAWIAEPGTELLAQVDRAVGTAVTGIGSASPSTGSSRRIS